MIDRKKIIIGLKCWTSSDPYINTVDCMLKNCPYAGNDHCDLEIFNGALELLKAQEPRLVVKEDFVNADKYGYLPVFVEDKDGEMYWDCITDAALGDTVSRFWTMKPTDEQRKAVKWNEP